MVKKLVIIFGPPAVGKMTVGYELAKLTGLALFHNHMTIDLVLPFFTWGEPVLYRLVQEFRQRIFEEMAASDKPGMIFTYVWGLDLEGDKEEIDSLTRFFSEQGAQVYYAELQAELDERLRRNVSEFRLQQKAPKRNLAQSEANLLQMEEKYRMNTGEEGFFYPDQHIKIDNTHLSPQETARLIADAFGLIETDQA
jgi:hypothetical protein